MNARLTHGALYWVAVSVVLFGFCCACAFMVIELRRDRLALANNGAQNLLTVLSQDIDSTLRGGDRAIAGVAAKLSDPRLARMPPDLQQAFLFEGALSEPYFTSLLVLDRDGNVVRDAGRLPQRRDNFSDRTYFQAHAQGNANGLYISTPFQRRLTGSDQVLGLSRRVNAPDGSFAGVVVGTVRLEYFRELFAKTRLAEGDAINLFSDDGTLVMRNPYLFDQIGRDFSASENFRRFKAEGSGTFSGVAAIDGVHRIYNFTRVDGLPFIMNVALSEDGVLATWRKQALAVATLVAFLCVVAIALAHLVRREFLRRAAAEAVSQESEAQYRLLADHATDLIMRLDCKLTRRYVSPASRAMLGVDPAALLGRKTRELIHPDDWDRVSAMVAASRLSRAPTEAVYRVRHADGHYVWVEGRYSFVSDEEGFIVVLRDISHRKTAEIKLAAAHAELAHRADTDGLTGLANRRHFDERLASAVDEGNMVGKPVSLLLIDVDHFKYFNDTHGHQAGDECLRQVARRIVDCIRPTDLCARYGGEEIAVVLPGTGLSAAQRIGERIREAVASVGLLQDDLANTGVTVSIGCAALGDGSPPTGTSLVGVADEALYEAKRTGRNKVVVYPDFKSDNGMPIPQEEDERLAAVAPYLTALPTIGSVVLDDTAREAAELFDVPIGFVSLVGEDDVTLVGRHGIGVGSVSRDIAFCAHTVAGTEPFIVGDLAVDPRFEDNPLIEGEGGLRFYAGAPVTDPSSGQVVGAVCVADTSPRSSTSSERDALRRLAARAQAELKKTLA